MKNAFRSGERIYFRPLEIEDIDRLVAFVNDPEIHQYLARVHPFNRCQEKEWIESLGKKADDVVLGIALKENDLLIGSCGLHRQNPVNRSAELGIAIGDARFHNQGYGSEAMGLLCAYGFDSLNLHRIELNVYGYNERAIRCYERAGFKLEGVRREGRFWNGAWHDIQLMSILEHEWRSASRNGKAGAAACQVMNP